MHDIEFKFEEVALCIGETIDRRQNIAFIYGTASITVHGRGDWEIEEVWLESPLMNEPKIKINPTSPAWGMIVDSINHDCGDNLWDKTIEFVAEHSDDRTRAERYA